MTTSDSRSSSLKPLISLIFLLSFPRTSLSYRPGDTFPMSKMAQYHSEEAAKQASMAAAGALKAVAIITGDNRSIRGSLQFVQDINGATHVIGKITGLSPGLHGFHIHALGDTTNGCNSTGPHFNPLKKNHGAPTDQERHAGDLGNIVAGQDGVAEVRLMDMQIPLSGPHSILGRAVVVHADPDDLGRGGHELSKTTGNAGARIGCGIIGLQSAV
ncbi:superoxide dismutase [Cu-Zn] 2-like [Magnolia sinica]|uniref:superoxide dismutase [Cu-Zn] 2-like n=1 Tax=Magnolia sinica TaxID=86752 RepID=UPI00265AA4DC|nr:superoxide dismutase [Cu-Zn] 2-like [Magnolia sinica]